MSHIGDNQLLICVALLCYSTFILAGMLKFTYSVIFNQTQLGNGTCFKRSIGSC